MTKSTIFKFIVFAYVLGFIPQIIYFFNRDQTIWLTIAMWTPALAVLFTGEDARKMAFESLKQMGWKYWLYAFAIGFGVYGAAQLIWHFTGSGQLNTSMTLQRYLLVLAANPILTGLLGALGEEFGWRGFLQPALREKNGALKTYIIVGLIWAYWHLPVNLAGHNGTDFPVLNSLIIFPLSMVFMTIVFGWMRERSRSTWPAVYFHGVINTVTNAWIIQPKTEIVEKLTTTALWIIVGVIFALIILKKEKPSTHASAINPI